MISLSCECVFYFMVVGVTMVLKTGPDQPVQPVQPVTGA